MAFVVCRQCGLETFTVAYWSSIDYCGRCGAQLPRPRRIAETVASHSCLSSGPSRLSPGSEGVSPEPERSSSSV